MTSSTLPDRFTRTSRFWTFLAIFWLIRGIDLVIAGIGHGYSWLKHGFAADELPAIGGVRYANWVKRLCLIAGIVILVRQHQHRKMLVAHSSDLS